MSEPPPLIIREVENFVNETMRYSKKCSTLSQYYKKKHEEIQFIKSRYIKLGSFVLRYFEFLGKIRKEIHELLKNNLTIADVEDKYQTQQRNIIQELSGIYTDKDLESHDTFSEDLWNVQISEFKHFVEGVIDDIKLDNGNIQGRSNDEDYNARALVYIDNDTDAYLIRTDDNNNKDELLELAKYIKDRELPGFINQLKDFIKSNDILEDP